MKSTYSLRQQKTYSDYAEKTTEELRDAIATNKHVPEVLEIIKDILDERQESHVEDGDIFRLPNHLKIKIVPVLTDYDLSEETAKLEIIEEHKKTNEWFIIVDNNSNTQNILIRENFKEELKNGLINGRFNSACTIESHVKVKEGTWKQENITVKKFLQNFKELRMLYRPVWNHAIIGLKTGIIAGIAIKVLDTTIFLSSVDQTLGILFIVAMALMFIPKIGIMGMIIAGFVIGKITQVNIFLLAMVACLTGMILGCLPGMFIGGIVGLIRRGKLPKAHDAIIESIPTLSTMIGLPLIGGFGIIYSYLVYLNPFLIGILEKFNSN
jgi:hypothetical protein